MKLLYGRKRGKRVKRVDFVCVYIIQQGYKYSHYLQRSDKDGKWYTYEGIKENNIEEYSNLYFGKINSVKAFKRFIHKHKEYLPKGYKIVLQSKYVGYNIEYILS